jgi:hypothetical protein
MTSATKLCKKNELNACRGHEYVFKMNAALLLLLNRYASTDGKRTHNFQRNIVILLAQLSINVSHESKEVKTQKISAISSFLSRKKQPTRGMQK